MGSPDEQGPQTVASPAALSRRALPGIPNPAGAPIWVREAMWHETSTHGDWVASLLNWVDNARDLLYLDDQAPALRAIMVGSQVLRAHRMKIFQGRMRNGTPIAITSWVSKVGTKSYDVSHEVYRLPDNVLVAQITSTAVVVVDGKASALPNRDALLALVVPRETALEVNRDEARPPTAAWAHRTQVRPSDADSLGHINNAKYIFFVEDAKDAAARAGVLPADCQWSIRWTDPQRPPSETVELYIDYSREVQPYDWLDIHVWRSPQVADAVHYDFVRNGEVVTRVRTRTGPLARL